MLSLSDTGVGVGRYGLDTDSRDPLLQSLANFAPGLAGFDGVFLGSDMSMFCRSGTGDLGSITDTRANDMRVVLSASLHPGSLQSQAVGNKLMKKSLLLAHLAAKRDMVMNQSRGEIAKLMGAIEVGDRNVAALASRALLPSGDVNPNVDVRVVAAFQRAYDANKTLGLRAIRFQKVNALATTLRNNAMQQAALIQQIAVAQSAGQPNVVAALSAMYNTLGRESDKVRDIRKEQLANPTQSDALEGVVFGSFFKKLTKGVKKGFKKLKKGLKKGVKLVGKIPGVKSVSAIVGKGLKAVVKVAGKVLNAACRLATSTVARAAAKIGGQIAGTALGTVYGGPVGGKVGGAAGPIAGRHAVDALKAGCTAVKGLGLAKGKFKVGGFVKGIVKGVKTYAKKNFAPGRLLADVQATGGALLEGAGGASGILNQYGAGAIQQLGLGGQAQKFIGQALSATRGGVTSSPAAQNMLRQFGGPVGGALVTKLQGNPLRNNNVAQSVGRALMQQSVSGSASISPFLRQTLGL